MGIYIRLLVAYDGSPSSENALKQALKLAKRASAEVEVITALPGYEAEVELEAAGIEGALKGSVEPMHTKASAMARAEGVVLKTKAARGEAFRVIVSEAEAFDADLVVMGRRGLGRLSRVLLGSVTARVIGHTGRDVLVLPDDASLGFDRVLVAVDGSPYGKAALGAALMFAKSMGSRLHAVCVVEYGDELLAGAPGMVVKMEERCAAVLDESEREAREVGLGLDTSLAEGEAYRKVLDAAEDAGAGIIFMGSHGRKGLERLLMGSVTEKVIGHSARPVLVVKS